MTLTAGEWRRKTAPKVGIVETPLCDAGGPAGIDRLSMDCPAHGITAKLRRRSVLATIARGGVELWRAVTAVAFPGRIGGLFRLANPCASGDKSNEYNEGKHAALLSMGKLRSCHDLNHLLEHPLKGGNHGFNTIHDVALGDYGP